VVSVQTDLSRVYREKALEAATKAELAVDPTERQKLIDAATNWSRMADYEEAHFGGRRASKSASVNCP